MKVVPPKMIVDATLLSSTIPETDYPVWNAATTYAIGDYCMVAANHTIYKCLLANTNKYPPDNYGDLLSWYEVGKTNRWRMFDDTVASTTSSSTDIVVELDASMCDTVALFNIKGISVLMELYASDNTLMHSEEIQLLNDVYTDWADIFFIQPEFVGNVYAGYPISFSTKLKITIFASGGIASCGHCVIGKAKYLGMSQYGLKSGITDYSKKSINDYGQAYLSQGDYAETCEFDLWLDSQSRPQIKSILSSLRATAAVWYLDNTVDNPDSDMLLFGFFEDYSVVMQGPDLSVLNVSLQGLV